ncbi:peptidyl-prolyl cis-trans isomerase FKBP43 isoform X1 [Lolium perenne]|uniref:peptidyl-prolyl cis-trans isomerase FKBP43 isoform X1 n=1 Tax=Lolium perenne TaxID=4522 RepID=UPI0021F646BD|nr:peptidyl-prolyl cis-trans isomerase FKBP43-like isoform X1 [Lolium perenne]
MAFWGVEVKPGKPYTHRYQSSHGRLRISQATLGSCDAAKRSVLQCVVGNKAPIIVCSLNPRLAEMCHLEIELEEVDEVLFSVLGPSSVHLSGYYLRPSSRSGAGDDESESYGEDVGESDTDRDYDESEDSYESDFIDDGDDEVPADNDVSESMDDGDVCSSPDSHKTASEKHAGKVKRLRRSKKKHQVDSTDDEIEDSSCKPTARHNFRSIFDSGSEDEDLPANKTNASEEHASKVKRLQRLKKKHQVDSTEDEIEDSSCKPTTRHNFRSIFDSCSEDEDFLAKEEDLPANKTNASEEHADKVKRGRRLNKKHQVDSIDEKIEDSSCKPAFRRKPCSIFDSGSEDEDFLAKEKVLPSLSEKTNGKVSKENKPENVASKEETKKKSRNDRKRKSDTIDQDPASPMDETEVNGSSVPKQEAELKKKSKKKKRTASEADDGKHSNNIRTLENGLVIEDLSAGNQDAKVASNGSKVYINYVGKLQNGKTVHPNAKEKPYKFKLGSEKVIPGWNLGIDGMHVGDKRRLTVPPALCENGGKLFEQVPKNKTIFYEVELVKVK